MVIEVADSHVHWMEPRDITLDEVCRGTSDRSGPRICSHHMASGGFVFQEEVAGANALLSDGSVRFIQSGCRRRPSGACSLAT